MIECRCAGARDDVVLAGILSGTSSIAWGVTGINKNNVRCIKGEGNDEAAVLQHDI